MASIEDLSKRISELEDIVRSLALSVCYGTDEPLEQFMAKNQIGGSRRSAINLALRAVSMRAVGKDPESIPGGEISREYPILHRAYEKGMLTLDEILEILSDLVGSKESALELMRAHKARGLAPEAYARIGLD